MSLKVPGYRIFFNDNIEYEDLILIIAPISRSVVEDRRVWGYTKRIAGKMRNPLHSDQHARDLLDFIHDRRNQPQFLVLMRDVLMDQPDLTGHLKEELSILGGEHITSSSTPVWHAC